MRIVIDAAARYRGRKVMTVADLTLVDFDTSRGSVDGWPPALSP